MVLAAVALRIAYYDEAYQHYDEPIIVGVVQSVRETGKWDTNWEHCWVPAEFGGPQFNFSSFHLAAHLFRRAVELAPGKSLAEWAALREGLLVYRIFSILLSVLAVAVTARLAWKVTDGDKFATAGAAILCAVAPILVQDAHYGRPEAFVTFLFVAVLLGSLPAARLRLPCVAASSFGFGLLLACKISFLPLAWVPLVPILVAWRGGAELRTVLVAVGLVGVGLAAGFGAGAPWAVLEPRQYLAGVYRLQRQYGSEQAPYGHFEGGPVWDIVVSYFGTTFGWLVIGLGLLGAGVLVYRRRWALSALLAGPLFITFVLFGRQRVFFERNFSHVVPLGLLLAAVGAAWLLARVPARGPRFVGLVVLAIAVLFRPLSISGRILTYGFSGATERAVAAKRAELEKTYPDLVWISSDWGHWWRQVGEKVTAHFVSGDPRPLVFDGQMFGDEWTKISEAQFKQRLELVDLATLPTAFPDGPTCTLQTYLSPTHRILLVRKPR